MIRTYDLIHRFFNVNNLRNYKNNNFLKVEHFQYIEYNIIKNKIRRG